MTISKAFYGTCSYVHAQYMMCSKIAGDIHLQQVKLLIVILAILSTICFVNHSGFLVETVRTVTFHEDQLLNLASTSKVNEF